MAGTTAAGIGALLAGVHSWVAAGPRLTVGPIRRVGADGTKYFEPWIAANPCDPANLVIVGSHVLGDPFHKEPAASFTKDGGLVGGEFVRLLHGAAPQERISFTTR